MRERPALFLGLLADQPELIAEVGVLRWRAAGSVGTPGPWIESTARDAGRDDLPLTLVAMDLDGHAIGAVTLGRQDDGRDLSGAGSLTADSSESSSDGLYGACEPFLVSHDRPVVYKFSFGVKREQPEGRPTWAKP